MKLWGAVPLVVAIVTFLSYSMTGHQITASVVFPVLSVIVMIKMPLSLFPSVIASAIEARVSLQRLCKYLNSEELEIASVRKFGNDVEFPVRLTDAFFSWTGRQQPTLSNIVLRVPRGSLIAVCGPVASGKSALLAGILGG